MKLVSRIGHFLALFVLIVGLLLGMTGVIASCTATLPVDLYAGVGTGVAVTARGGKEVALLEARRCLDRPTRTEANACLVPWRERWSQIATAWQGAASSSQSLAHVVRTVDAMLDRRFPTVVVDAGVEAVEQ